MNSDEDIKNQMMEKLGIRNIAQPTYEGSFYPGIIEKSSDVRKDLNKPSPVPYPTERRLKIMRPEERHVAYNTHNVEPVENTLRVVPFKAQ
jgi:hypothetical protein